ncbi:phospholipid scramblase 1-like [Ptychodera flava]|uniref:phospholipid scramblase 1-like n=1 Tax=Ptychodera flava TaxID=63121 RepID=UPI003969BB62
MSRTPVREQPRSRPRTAESLELKWFSRRGGNPGGLGVLADVNYLRIQQTLETLGSGCNSNNAYNIVNKQGELVFCAREKTTCCSRFWCGPARRFDMAIENENGDEILQFVRRVRCDACCCCCCLDKIMIQTPVGEVLGYVKERCSFCGASYKILDSDNDELFRITSPACPCRCYRDSLFPIVDEYDDEVGIIRKQWGGKKKYANMDHETFIIAFPEGIDIQTKAIILGGAFLVNYMFFEMT